jgi:hypothetical protein
MEALDERRERLHDALGDVADRLDDVQLLRALAAVMSRVSGEGIPDSEAPVVPAAAADDMVASADLVNSVLKGIPWLTGAGHADVVQQWITYSGHTSERRTPAVLGPERFRPTSSLSDADLGRRPLPGGLFTSSAVPGRPSMWKLFISLNVNRNEDANLWRRPWVTWWLRPHPGARVLQVESAVDWVRLVSDAPLRRPDGLLAVNWRVLGGRFDGVHLHPQAVAALDGFRFECEEGLTAPVYFSVESTLWLNWRFAAWGQAESPVP